MRDFKKKSEHTVHAHEGEDAVLKLKETETYSWLLASGLANHSQPRPYFISTPIGTGNRQVNSECDGKKNLVLTMCKAEVRHIQLKLKSDVFRWEAHNCNTTQQTSFWRWTANKKKYGFRMLVSTDSGGSITEARMTWGRKGIVNNVNKAYRYVYKALEMNLNS